MQAEAHTPTRPQPAGTRMEAARQTYVTFQLADQTFGITVRRVREILDRQRIMRLPNSARDCIGVIDTRGQSIPVIDLAKRFAMPGVEEGEDTRIIVLDFVEGDETRTLGIRVDRVLDVTTIAAEEVETAPRSAFDSVAPQAVAGLARLGGVLVALLHAGCLFDAEELDTLAGVRA